MACVPRHAARYSTALAMLSCPLLRCTVAVTKRRERRVGPAAAAVNEAEDANQKVEARLESSENDSVATLHERLLADRVLDKNSRQ